MAGRGARARKVVEKQVQKEEVKRAEKDYKESFKRPGAPDPRAGSATPTPRNFLQDQQHRHGAPNTHPARKGSVLGSNVSVQSDESERSKNSSAVDKISQKLTGVAPEKKYIGNTGRATAAPRGRMGGVPVKIKELEAVKEERRARRRSEDQQSYQHQHYNHHHHDHEMTALSRTESSAQTSISSDPNMRGWENAKIYYGNGQPTKRFQGFAKEEDLWMEDGDCLVYFAEETDEDSPHPLLRVHAKVLYRARSAFLDNLLKYGEIPQEELDVTPLADSALPPRLPAWPLTSTSLGSLSQLLSGGETEIHDFPIPPRTPEVRSHRSTGSHDWSDGFTAVDGITPARAADNVRIPPSISESETMSSIALGDVAPSNAGNAEPEITHEVWFRAPTHIKRLDVQRRHHMATRNFIALLYGLPIVGNDYFEMLSDLQNVMDTYYELNEPGERWNTTQVLIQYLVARKLDDVRNDLSAALGLLAWCEQPNVGWDAGWLEAFVHSVGMLTPKTLESKEQLRNLSPATRHRLSGAYNALQHKLSEAEGRLARFSFEELWYVDGITPDHPAQVSFETLREALYQFYAGEYGEWPPNASARKHSRNNSITAHQAQSAPRWLSRELVQRLQIDFGSMYDWLVDRDIVWEASEERHTRKWEMVSKHPRGGLLFAPDAPGLPLTSMLVGFDSSQRYEHLPHPYPLIPASARTDSFASSGTNLPDQKDKSKDKKKGLFGGLSSKLAAAGKKPSDEAAKIPDAKTQYQLSLAYTGATNAARLPSHFASNSLIDALIVHEKTDVLAPSCTPIQARLGRWVLLYGILQVLSTISVDTAGLKYSDGVRYFVSCGLEGCPPWRSETEPQGQRIMLEASQQRSYCWLAPKTWKETARAVHELSSAGVRNDFRPPVNEFQDQSLSPQPSLTGLNYGVLPGLQSLNTANAATVRVPRTQRVDVSTTNTMASAAQPRGRAAPDSNFITNLSIPTPTSPAPPAYSPASPTSRILPTMNGNAFSQSNMGTSSTIMTQNTTRQRLPIAESEQRNRARDIEPHPLQAPHLHLSSDLSTHDSDADHSDNVPTIEPGTHANTNPRNAAALRAAATKAANRTGYLMTGINRTITPTTSTEDTLSSLHSGKPLGHSVVVSSPHGEFELRPRGMALPALDTRGATSTGAMNGATSAGGANSASPSMADFAEFDALSAGAGTGLLAGGLRGPNKEMRGANGLLGRSERDIGSVISDRSYSSSRERLTDSGRSSKRSTLNHQTKSPLRLPGQTSSPVSYSPFPASPVDGGAGRIGLGLRGGIKGRTVVETVTETNNYL